MLETGVNRKLDLMAGSLSEPEANGLCIIRFLLNFSKTGPEAGIFYVFAFFGVEQPGQPVQPRICFHQGSV